MVHRPNQQKNGPLTNEIAILNLERRAHWNFKFIRNKWKMAHTMVYPAITLHYIYTHIFKCNANGNVEYIKQAAGMTFHYSA